MAGDLVAHWVADDLEATVADGDRVTSWVDRVTSLSVTSTGQPALVHNALSGRGVVHFDGTDGNDSLKVTPSPLANANDFTVAVVFRTDSSSLAAGGTNWFNAAGLVAGSRIGLDKDWGLTIDASGKVGAGTGGGFGVTPASIFSASNGLNDGQLHVATLTRSGGTISLYIDDVAAVTRTDANADARGGSIPLTIGGLDESTNVNSASAFTGDIAEVRVYNGQLSAAEVSTLYNQLHSDYFNIAPVANADSYNLTEDPAFGFHAIVASNGVLKNDTDAEGNDLTAVLVDTTQHGTLGLSPDGSFSYAPARDFFGTDTFTYRAADGQESNLVTVTLNVSNTYDAAVANADSYKLMPTQTLNVATAQGVLSNDTNLDQVTLTASVVSNPSFGTLSLQADGSFQFNPQGQAGTTSFTYRVNDGTQQSAPATVTLIVNTPPVANNDTFNLNEDVVLVRTPANGVAANDTDADGNAVVASLVAEPQHGTVTLQADGGFTYTPAADYFGADSFTYQLSDGEDVSGIGVVNLTVQAVNDAPLGKEDVYYRPVGEAFNIDSAIGVLANDTDIDSASLTASVATQPAHGTLTMQSDGAFVYTPTQGYKGTDEFTYRTSDGSAQSDPIKVTLLVGEAPFRISEFMAAYTTGLTDIETRVRTSPTANFSGLRSTPDWIELQNMTSSVVDISGYHLTDTSSVPDRWAFPEGTTIPADGYLIVYADRLNITDPALDERGRLHLNFKLGVEGEYLALTSPEGEVIQSFDAYPQQRADVSYGYTESGPLGYLLTASPGAANGASYNGIVSKPTSSVPRGFYDAAFSVALSSNDIGAVIRYTTDGSEPTVDHGTVYANPIAISGTTVLKSAAFKDNYVSSEVNADTYLFAAQVLQQDDTGIPGSIRWGHAGPDWEMDPLIVNNADPEIRPEVADLLRIPTVSVAVDPIAMFGQGGIYIAGENVEKPITFEFFDPNRPDAGVQTNSTIQIVGGSSPQRWKSDKLSMRVKFTEDAGESELQYPVFGADATTIFDTLVLDARLNNVWHYGGGSSPQFQRNIAQYMRDEFAADLQNEVGGTATHGQHVHVYLNGIYWGIHTLHERPDENFAATYLGGDGEDYDVIKHDVNTVVSGSNQPYKDMIAALGRSGSLTDEQYQAVGEMLDVDDFINYMLVNIYGGNQDWDHHNWYASRNRVDGKWRFHSWDAEKVLQGVNDNVTGLNNANSPSFINNRLLTNPEYKQRFEDVVQKHFFHDGAMTPEATAALYAWRSDQIDLVMRVESARWGDNQITTGDRKRYTRLDWVATRQGMYDNYFPRRTTVVLNQMQSKGWIKLGEDVEFNVGGSPQYGGHVAAGGNVTMTGAAG
ncbi:MAG: tandem-95 repeat protein, partial [Planctomycetales bacterium]|nr:tandem-95 repeat protein [Planctomycetales bacterium]